MKSYIMVRSDVFSDNIQNTLFLSTHSCKINRNFPSHSTVNACQIPKNTQLFSSLHRPQNSTFSLVQELYHHSGLCWLEVHCQCNWIQSCHLLLNFHLSFLNWSWSFLWDYLASAWWGVDGTGCLHSLLCSPVLWLWGLLPCCSGAPLAPCSASLWCSLPLAGRWVHIYQYMFINMRTNLEIYRKNMHILRTEVGSNCQWIGNLFTFWRHPLQYLHTSTPTIILKHSV